MKNLKYKPKLLLEHDYEMEVFKELEYTHTPMEYWEYCKFAVEREE